METHASRHPENSRSVHTVDSIFIREHIVHAREKIIQVVVRTSRRSGSHRSGVVDIFVIQLADKRGGLAAGFLPPFHADGAVGKSQ